jgi:hypothetical protein
MKKVDSGSQDVKTVDMESSVHGFMVLIFMIGVQDL